MQNIITIMGNKYLLSNFGFNQPVGGQAAVVGRQMVAFGDKQQDCIPPSIVLFADLLDTLPYDSMCSAWVAGGQQWFYAIEAHPFQEPGSQDCLPCCIVLLNHCSWECITQVSPELQARSRAAQCQAEKLSLSTIYKQWS
jgi:hypothetical protein